MKKPRVRRAWRELANSHCSVAVSPSAPRSAESAVVGIASWIQRLRVLVPTETRAHVHTGLASTLECSDQIGGERLAGSGDLVFGRKHTRRANSHRDAGAAWIRKLRLNETNP